ncbi:Ran GTPase-activating protein [Trachipleistophora hominis]|uniref:Ran GTPase-activating protein n=1 Tax=Trachipleistophora hominis TaxID=72359 RepID=L7JZW5_TRAHO|nr:Ran GTPase-activating protein [Trachipleistophora hominis]
MLLSIADEGKRYKDTKDVQKLFPKISDEIKTVNLTGNVFHSPALRELFKELKKIKKLERLIASKIFSALPSSELLIGLSIIGEFVDPANLVELDLSENAISTVLPETFVEFLTRADKLKVLRMSDCGLGAIGGKNLAMALEQIKDKSSLEYIDISKNKLDYGATEMGKTLSAFPNLKTIKIQYNSIKRASMDDFIKSFELYFPTSLDLRDNLISVEGCKNLGKYFVSWETEELFLGDCLVGNEGLEAFIAEASKKISKEAEDKSTNNLVLDFSYNNISQQGVNLLESYSKHITVKKLMIYGNDFEDCSALVGHISKNKGRVVYEDPEETEKNVIDESLVEKFAKIL